MGEASSSPQEFEDRVEDVVGVVGIADDSAELDTVAPVVVQGGSSGGREACVEAALESRARVTPALVADKSPAAQSAQVQSAAAVGHGVQLRTRLMYRLL